CSKQMQQIARAKAVWYPKAILIKTIGKYKKALEAYHHAIAKKATNATIKKKRATLQKNAQAILSIIRQQTFYQRVWNVVYTIPSGTTMTYAQVAQAIGKPTAYRAVGQALKNNPFFPEVPCHRVVQNKGIGGFNQGRAKKQELLANEAKDKPKKESVKEVR
ncbi:MAG: MGMT family protein, partial [Candidatus Woesearchaeota archaeon]